MLVSKHDLEKVVLSALKDVTPAPTAKEPEDKFLTSEEVCKLLRITAPTLLDIRKKGHLNSYKPNKRVLFKKSEVLAYVDNTKQRYS